MYRLVSLAACAALFFCGTAYPQWINDPAKNTKVVVDAKDPVNISSVEDLKGGAFVFWEDNKTGFQSEIYFIHLDNNGEVTFRADGKKISELGGQKTNPVAASIQPNTAVAVWKDFSLNKNGNLFAQKVFFNGNLLWNRNGIQITPNIFEVSEYAVATDKNGSSFVSYISKEKEFVPEYQVRLQKITSTGGLPFERQGTVIHSSANRKSSTYIIADNAGGAYVFWLETQNSKGILYGQRIDSTGKSLWGKNPLVISGNGQNVISYSLQKTDFNSIYIAWQVLKSDRDIYHQLIGFNGKPLWTNGGKLATPLKGNQSNPQVLTADSTIILSWTNEVDKNKDVYIQKYTTKGAPRWGESGVRVTRDPKDQFGPKLLSDDKAGAIVSWIDNRVAGKRANIYAQRVNGSGKIVWDTLGIAAASYENSEKSYQSMVSDLRGGAILIFKDRKEGKGDIYAQKIFNTGTYISQIVGFNSEVQGDSVKISWYSANELGNTEYDIERTSQSDNAASDWRIIKKLHSSGGKNATYYEVFDNPGAAGSYYYRVVQRDDNGNVQPSNVARADYMSANTDLMVSQNTPNPFSDETTINFYLPNTARVKIEFFDSHVEKVKEVNDTFSPGGHKITFSAAGLQPGIYFYRFEVGDFVDVKKMVITK